MMEGIYLKINNDSAKKKQGQAVRVEKGREKRNPSVIHLCRRWLWRIIDGENIPIQLPAAQALLPLLGRCRLCLSPSSTG